MKLDVLVSGEDRHLGLALQVALCERGYLVMFEQDGSEVPARINEFSPSLLVCAFFTSVVFYHFGSGELFNVGRPLDVAELLNALPDPAPLASDQTLVPIRESH